MRKLTTMAASVALAVGTAGVYADTDIPGEDTSPAAWVRLTVEETQGFGGGNPTSNPSGGTPSGDTNNPPAPMGYNPDAGSADGISYDQKLYLSCNGATTCMPMATGYWLHHSNTQKNKYACAGTDLYKSTNNDPNASSPGTADDKVPLKTSAGAQMSASKSTVTETGNSTGTGAFETTFMHGGWDWYRFGYVNFDAADPQPTQWVGCKLTWNQNDSEKAVGTYGGFMKVFAMNGNTEETNENGGSSGP